MKNLRNLKTSCAALLILAAIGGCAETSRVEATGKGTIRGVNGIVTAPELSFKIEEAPIGNAKFKQAAGFSPFDDLSYDFNFDVILPGETDPTRLASQFIDVVADTEYTIVIGGTVAVPTITMWEEPERDWADGVTSFEADFVHLSPALGEVDVYFAPLGSVPLQGEAVGTLNYGDRVPYQEFPEGNRELFITLRDDPDNYLYRSQTVASTPATRATYAIFDPDPTITANIAVSIFGDSGSSSSLPDVGSRPEFRLLHAAFGTGNVDAYLNNDFGTIVFANTAFGDITTYNEVEPVSMPLTLTDVGNPGAPVHEEDIAIGGNTKHTVFLTGAPGSLSLVDFRDDARPFETSPQVRLSNMSVNSSGINIYMQPPGTVIEATTPIRFPGLPSLASTGYMTPTAGMYEITITGVTDVAPIGAPITIDIVNGDIVEIAILDTVDPALVESFIFDSTVP